MAPACWWLGSHLHVRTHERAFYSCILVHMQYRWHPSQYTTPAARQRAEMRFEKITEAYMILSDPSRRREYDSAHPQDAPIAASTSRGRPGRSTPRSRTTLTRDRDDEGSSDTWSMCDDWFADEENDNPPRPPPGYRRGRRRQPMHSDIFATLASLPLFPSDRTVLRICSKVTNFLHKTLDSATEAARKAGARLLPSMLGKTTETEITWDEHGKMIERVSTFTNRRDGTTVIETIDRRLTHEEVMRLRSGKELHPGRVFLRKLSKVLTRIAMQLLAVYVVARAWDVVLAIHFLFW
mmetsp:Transcript_31161/g.60156  ORF Transcript_31161/g.60156 Transcript_31161/m.60156 type:complete len:295 (-) Transcript_31161:319-1203(-)